MRTEEIGSARLYLGDCREVLPELSPVVILTDPPWGMGYRSGHNSSRRPDDDMVRKDGNFAPIVGDNQVFDPLPWLAWSEHVIFWGAQHFCNRLPPGRRWLVWNKLAGKTPVPSGSDVELAWTSAVGPSRIFTHLWRGIMRAGEENIVNSPKLHPNQKPVALMAWCLTMLPAATVLDPYMGSGSTIVAALRAGRPSIGVEIEEKYFDIACRRAEAETRQQRMAL